MKLWRKEYTLRTFGVQKTKKGYASTKEYTDTVVKLDVQPDTGTQLQVLAEGERRTMRLYTFGDFPIKTADQKTGIRADMLFYAGRWYECVSSVLHSNTPLAHYKSAFLSVPESANATDVNPPESQEIPEIPEEPEVPEEPETPEEQEADVVGGEDE